MGMGMLFAGALAGGAKGMESILADQSRREEKELEWQRAATMKRQELLDAMELKEQYALRDDDRKARIEDERRRLKAGAIQSRLGANADAATAGMFGVPTMGDTPLSPEQQAVFDEGMARNEVEKAQARKAFMANPQNMVQAAVQEGYESPTVLMKDGTARETALLRAESSAAQRELQAQIAQLRAENAGKDKPPAGYRPTAGGNLEAIPGGPADQKIQGAFNADTAQLTGSIAGFDRLASAANQLLGHPGLDGITGPWGTLPNFPGGNAADAQALLNNLKSQVGFGVLQDMRNSSKTGGALGSVSDAEGKRLEANLAALDKAQSLDQFKKSLGQILDYTEKAKDRMREAFNMKHGERQPTPASAGTPRVNSLEEAMALPSGTTFITPNGKLKVR